MQNLIQQAWEGLRSGISNKLTDDAEAGLRSLFE